MMIKDEGSSPPSAKRRKREGELGTKPAPSWVWDYCDKDETGKHAICGLCPNETTKFAYSGGTSTMARHLRKKHQKFPPGYDPNADPDAAMKGRTPKLMGGKKKLVGGVGKVNSLSRKAQGRVLGKKLMNYFLWELQPFETADTNQAFAEFVKALDPKYRMPSDSALHELLRKTYNKCKEKVKAILSTVVSVNIAVDYFEAISQQPLMVITAHWVSDDFELRSVALHVAKLPMHHGAGDVATYLGDFFDYWKIRHRVTTVVTKDWTDFSTAMHTYPQMKHESCVANALQVAAEKGLQKCSALIEKCRGLAMYFTNSEEENSKLIRFHKQLVPDSDINIICDATDRWNSTCHMISRLVEMEAAIGMYRAALENENVPDMQDALTRLSTFYPTEEEWGTMKELGRLLQPIESATHLISGHEYPTLSLMYPVMHGLMKHLEKTEWIEHKITRQVKAELLRLMSKHQTDPGETAYIACLLDPRFKTLPFLDNDAEKEIAINHLKQVYNEALAEKGKVASAKVKMTAKNKKKRTSLMSELFPSDGKEADEEITPKTEVEIYLDSPPQAAREYNDPLSWWKKYQTMFPVLSHLAKKYLSIPASSVPFDQLFADSGRAYAEKRRRVNPDIISEVLFTRSCINLQEIYPSD